MLRKMKVQDLKLISPVFLLLCVALTHSLDCKKKLDVVVVVDASQSIQRADFLKLKNAIIQLATDLNLGPDDKRVGAIVFSHVVTDTIPLSTDFQDLEAKISSITQPRRNTATHQGIQAMIDLFQSQYREDARQVGIVITDGKSNYETATMQAAEDAKNAGITMFAVGVGHGRNLNMDELYAIGSDSSYVLHLENFDLLIPMFKSLVEDICTECKGELDIVAVLDASGSIGRRKFEILKDAAIQVLDDLELGPDAQRFGVVVFNHKVIHTIPLSSDFNDLIDKISSMSHAEGGTSTHRGIIAMKDMFEALGREGVRKVGIVLTDGISKSRDNTRKAAEEAKEAGITMFAVGLGSEKRLSMNELYDIASSPSDVLHLKDFGLLKNKFKSLLGTLCGGNEAQQVDYRGI